MARTCILVLGMHRSGTSALCGVLHQLGAERPVRELPPQPDNEKGFFEPSEIVTIHDRLLESAGLTWFDWEPLTTSWKGSSRREAFIDELVDAAGQDFPGRGPLLVKDPRVCLFAEVWFDVLARIQAKPVVILQYRQPIEVAQSLKRRNGFPIAHGLLLWLRYVIEAERATRTVERSFVNYANLMEDWHDELAPTLAEDRLNLAKMSARAMAMAGDFLDPSLHHQVKPSTPARVHLHPWVDAAFDALERLREDSNDPAAMETLDGIGGAFDSACTAFAPAFHQISVHLAHLQRNTERLPDVEAALAASQQVVAAWTPLVERVSVLEAERDEATGALAAARTEADRVPELEAMLAETRTNLEALSAKSEQVSHLQSELASAHRHVSELQKALAAALDGDPADGSPAPSMPLTPSETAPLNS